MTVATVITEGFGGFSTVNFVPLEGFLAGGTPPSPPPPPSYDPLAQHGGQGRRRWDRIRAIAKERPDDVVLADHVAALVAHLLGIPPSRPVPRKAVAVVAAAEDVRDALETFQWEVAEARARAAILESKVAGLERQKAKLLKDIEDENDDEEAMEIILGHA